jgi:hypothetical protein
MQDASKDHLLKRRLHASMAELKRRIAEALNQARAAMDDARSRGATTEIDALVAEVRQRDPALADDVRRYYDAIEDPAFLLKQMTSLWEQARDHGHTVAEELEHILGGDNHEFRNTPGLTPEQAYEELRKVVQDPRTLIDLSNAHDYHGSHTHAFHQFLGDQLFGPGEGLTFRQRLAGLEGTSQTVRAGSPDQFEKPFWARLWDEMFDSFDNLHGPEVLGAILQHHLDFPRWLP